MAGGVGDVNQVAAPVVGVFGDSAGGVADGNRQVQSVVVVDLGAAAVGRGDADHVAEGVIAETGFAAEFVALKGNPPPVVAFGVAAVNDS